MSWWESSSGSSGYQNEKWSRDYMYVMRERARVLMAVSSLEGQKKNKTTISRLEVGIECRMGGVRLQRVKSDDAAPAAIV